MENLKLAEVIGRAPWRKAVTYRHSSPHEYVLSRLDAQRELFKMICARFRAGDGVAATFFGRRNTYLFVDDYRYWLLTHWNAVDLDDGQDYVLKRSRLDRDRSDFASQPGDAGRFGNSPRRSCGDRQRRQRAAVR